MKYGKSICKGYAELFQDLCTSFGILSFYVTGNTIEGSHAINYVVIDGYIYSTEPQGRKLVSDDTGDIIVWITIYDGLDNTESDRDNSLKFTADKQYKELYHCKHFKIASDKHRMKVNCDIEDFLDTLETPTQKYV